MSEFQIKRAIRYAMEQSAGLVETLLQEPRPENERRVLKIAADRIRGCVDAAIDAHFRALKTEN